MAAITVYSITGCPPCDALKKWLRDNNVAFTDIKIRTLDPTERARIRDKIIDASTIKQPLMPAVHIATDTTEHWVVNNGLSGNPDVDEMIDKLKQTLKL